MKTQVDSVTFRMVLLNRLDVGTTDPQTPDQHDAAGVFSCRESGMGDETITYVPWREVAHLFDDRSRDGHSEPDPYPNPSRPANDCTLAGMATAITKSRRKNAVALRHAARCVGTAQYPCPYCGRGRWDGAEAV